MIDFERSLLYAWVLSFVIDFLEDMYAICVFFFICVEISLLYAWVLTQQIISIADLNTSSPQLPRQIILVIILTAELNR